MMRTVVLALIGMVFGIGCGSTGSGGGLTTAGGLNSNNQRQPTTNPNETFLIEDLSVKIGEEIIFEVTGSIIGEVYGTDQYTGDSSVSVAVVHAGILKRGQTGKVVLKIVPGDKAYKSSTRNGVRSYNWNEFKFGYTLAKADADAKIQKLISILTIPLLTLINNLSTISSKLSSRILLYTYASSQSRSNLASPYSDLRRRDSTPRVAA